MIQYVVGPYYTMPTEEFKSSIYKLHRRKAVEWAASISREIAEGPTIYVPDNYYGPVELWPLVLEASSVVHG